MPQNYFFDIPHELRRLAEDNVDRARQLYLQFLDGVSKAMAIWPSTSSDVITPGFKEVRERAVKFAKENADLAFALAGDVAKAKDIRELLRSRPVTYNLRCDDMRIRHKSLDIW